MQRMKTLLLLTLSSTHQLFTALAKVVRRAGAQKVIKSKPVAATDGHADILPIAVPVVVCKTEEVPEQQSGPRETWE